MPTVELDIRQLADEGGTAPLAPITVTDAVLDENGDTLTDILDEIKSGLTNLSQATFTTTIGNSSGTVTVFKKCGLAWFTVDLGTGSGSFSAYTSGMSIGTIPSGFRPKRTVMVAGVKIRDSGAWASANYYDLTTVVSENGTVALRGNETTVKAGQYMWGTVMYPVE